MNSNKKMVAKVFCVFLLVCSIQIIKADVETDITVNYQITPEFMNLFNHKDEFGPLLTLSVMESPLINSNPNTLPCYEKELTAYKTIVTKYASGLKELAKGVKPRQKGDLNRPLQSIKNYLTGISEATELYPESIKSIMTDKDYDVAVDYLNEVLFKVEFGENHLLAALIRSIKKKQADEEKLKKIESKYKKLRTETKEESAKVLPKFVQCIKTSNYTLE